MFRGLLKSVWGVFDLSGRWQPFFLLKPSFGFGIVLVILLPSHFFSLFFHAIITRTTSLTCYEFARKSQNQAGLTACQARAHLPLRSLPTDANKNCFCARMTIAVVSDSAAAGDNVQLTYVHVAIEYSHTSVVCRNVSLCVRDKEATQEAYEGNVMMKMSCYIDQCRWYWRRL